MMKILKIFGIGLLSGLIVAEAAASEGATPDCQVNEGLAMLNQPGVALSNVQAILVSCDQKKPNDSRTLLLHGLLAREQGDYKLATYWLKKSAEAASDHDFVASLELAVTYEWLKQFDEAKSIYQAVLTKEPNSRPALLGLARIALAHQHLKEAAAIYQTFLTKNPLDIDALNGMGWVSLADKKLTAAKHFFKQVIAIKPDDNDARTGLREIDQITLYQLDILGGQNSFGGQNSSAAYINFSAALNVTDELLIALEHHSTEIQGGSFTDPSVLPRNAFSIGFQRNKFAAYGWGISYEYRERQSSTTEHRVAVNGDIFLLPKLQLFGGIRQGLPSPWLNRLYYSGLTFYTNMPWDISTTAYLGDEQIAGYNFSYALDLSKEYAHGFYDVGVAYSPTIRNWQVHGRVVVPIIKNTALQMGCEHYFFNNITYFSVGLRFYF